MRKLSPYTYIENALRPPPIVGVHHIVCVQHVI